MLCTYNNSQIECRKQKTWSCTNVIPVIPSVFPLYVVDDKSGVLNMEPLSFDNNPVSHPLQPGEVFRICLILAIEPHFLPSHCTLALLIYRDSRSEENVDIFARLDFVVHHLINSMASEAHAIIVGNWSEANLAHGLIGVVL